MLSAKTLFQEIVDHDDSFALFCSIAASGESQGGWENARIAALVPEAQRDLAPRSPGTAPTRTSTAASSTP
ncbi:hypothetical protein SHKM778_65280 [Streptomyces sp. KM77-8]|uniref:Uncharacterized protein n=1 Tax=Streptomyces haneummycinicus TaxID=3074435 RepID=A0AAT9HSA7_9ACTN